MATTSGIRGMLLEEAVLRLIAASGYNAVSYTKSDPTLDEDKGSLFVNGRGEKHQIDALADFFLLPPFSHQQRLIIEAKCYATPIRLPVMRNAVGVLTDISEFWSVPTTNTIVKQNKPVIPIRRYHYQCAVVSISGFAQTAQNYAFAHDIFLVSLAHSSYFQRVRQTLDAISPSLFGTRNTYDDTFVDLANLRKAIRSRLKDSRESHLSTIHIPQHVIGPLERFCNACQDVKIAIVAMLEKQFPFFLLPNPERIFDITRGIQDREIIDLGHMSIRRDREEGWIIQNKGEAFFSFDIPPRLLDLYLQHLPESEKDTLEMQALIMNLGQYVNSNLDDQLHTIKFQCSQRELQRVVQEPLW